jgi:hypothetical protein
VFVNIYLPGIRGEMYAGRLDKTYVKVVINSGQRVTISEKINEM